jgi:hypothetical protein
MLEDVELVYTGLGGEEGTRAISKEFVELYELQPISF